jgi:hypothetical protein
MLLKRLLLTNVVVTPATSQTVLHLLTQKQKATIVYNNGEKHAIIYKQA